MAERTVIVCDACGDAVYTPKYWYLSTLNSSDFYCRKDICEACIKQYVDEVITEGTEQINLSHKRNPNY